MCNEAARRTALGLMREDFSQLKILLRFPEGLPNLGDAPHIRITDTTVIVRAVGDAFEMVQRRWSWLGPASARGPGKPVYNFRSEGRRFDNAADHGRCLIPLDGFYEFTDAAGDEDTLTLPLQAQARPRSPVKGEGKRRKDKWLFTLADTAAPAWTGAPEMRAAPGLFAVAGLWRGGVDIGRGVLGGSVPSGSLPGESLQGEAFTMLTCEPGPDIAPYHRRQIVLIPRGSWADWLGGVVPAADLILPTPAGTLSVARA